MADDKKNQLPFPFIERKHANKLINQRAKDGYINATAMCEAAERPWGRYWETKQAKEFAAALSVDIGIPISDLIQSFKGGNAQLQGTWVHPQVAINLAQWLSPQFAVQVTTWVFEWLSGGSKVVERLPYHLRRYVANINAMPKTHFSMLQELTYILIAPLESGGYTLPENMLPDISEGRMFSDWLRKQGIDPGKFPTYRHAYEDGRVVEARLYPNQYLADFRAHFHNVWLPTKSQTYFAIRDPKALPHLQPLLPTPTKKKAIA